MPSPCSIPPETPAEKLSIQLSISRQGNARRQGPDRPRASSRVSITPGSTGFRAAAGPSSTAMPPRLCAKTHLRRRRPLRHGRLPPSPSCSICWANPPVQRITGKTYQRPDMDAKTAGESDITWKSSPPSCASPAICRWTSRSLAIHLDNSRASSIVGSKAASVCTLRLLHQRPAPRHRQQIDVGNPSRWSQLGGERRCLTTPLNITGSPPCRAVSRSCPRPNWPSSHARLRRHLPVR